MVRTKTRNLDKRIETLEGLVAVYESFVSAERGGSDDTRMRRGGQRRVPIEFGVDVHRVSSTDSSSPSSASSSLFSLQSTDTAPCSSSPTLLSEQEQEGEEFFRNIFAPDK